MFEIGWLAEMLLCFGKRYDRAGMVDVLIWSGIIQIYKMDGATHELVVL
jgi:hypothetical protein